MRSFLCLHGATDSPLITKRFIRVNEEDIFNAITALYSQVRGAYACVAMIAGFGIVAFRDPNGIRPCVYGYRETAYGKDWMIASESVALDALGYKNIVDLLPGMKSGQFLSGKFFFLSYHYRRGHYYYTSFPKTSPTTMYPSSSPQTLSI